MIAKIFAITPAWVWGLLIALVWLGLSQTVARVVSFNRVMLVSLGMTGFSLYGTLATFGGRPEVLLTWLAAAGVAVWLTLQRPLSSQTQYLPATRTFAMPGSWVPFFLIMAVFMAKYLVGLSTALQLEIIKQGGFGIAAGALYGACSGAFIGRALRLWRLSTAVTSMKTDSRSPIMF